MTYPKLKEFIFDRSCRTRTGRSCLAAASSEVEHVLPESCLTLAWGRGRARPHLCHASLRLGEMHQGPSRSCVCRAHRLPCCKSMSSTSVERESKNTEHKREPPLKIIVKSSPAMRSKIEPVWGDLRVMKIAEMRKIVECRLKKWNSTLQVPTMKDLSLLSTTHYRQVIFLE